MQELENLISISNRFSKAKKKPDGEYLGQAYLIYLKAKEKYKEEKGEFLKWIGHQINRKLRNKKHPYDRYKKKYIRGDGIPSKPRFELSRFMAQLNQDAQFVVLLIINPPLEVILMQGKKGIKRHIKNAIKVFLRMLHWTYARIYKAFNEIRETLQGGVV